MTNPDLTVKFEEERLRVHEQSQIIYLQGQIDELRRQLKDQNNKYNWVVEQVRKAEAAAAQVQALVERQAEELTRTSEAARRDIGTLRKEIAGALVKSEEGVRPMREMQLQIQQLAEARRQDRDSVVGWFARIEQSEQKFQHLQAQIKEADERTRQYSLQFDRLREADAVAVQEARKVGEEFQIEKQNLRRQSIESQQLVADVNQVLEEHNARIVRLDDIRQHIEMFAETLPSQYQELAARLPDITTEIKRVERISTERFLMNQERLEEIRHQADEKLDMLQQVDQQHLRQLTAWLERIDGMLRELEQRISRSTNRLEAVQHSYIDRIAEIEKREIVSITTLAAAFRDQAEWIKAAQIEAKGNEEEGGTS